MQEDVRLGPRQQAVLQSMGTVFTQAMHSAARERKDAAQKILAVQPFVESTDLLIGLLA